MEEVACPLCGAASSRRVLDGEFPLRRCAACGFYYVSPRPGPDEIGRYYPDDYTAHREVDVAEADRSRRRRSTRWDFLDSRRPGEVLDVGCGSGYELVPLLDAGWRACGIEVSAKAAEQARALGVETWVGPVERADFPGRSFDAVAMFHVIEHLHDPVRAMRNLRRMVKPGGVVGVVTPNIASMNFELFGGAWAHLDIPRHLGFFTAGTMARLAAGTGFRLVAWRCRSGTRGFKRSLKAKLGAGAGRVAWTAMAPPVWKVILHGVVDGWRWGDVAEYTLKPC